MGPDQPPDGQTGELMTPETTGLPKQQHDGNSHSDSFPSHQMDFHTLNWIMMPSEQRDAVFCVFVSPGLGGRRKC